MEALVDSIMSKKPESVDPDLTVTKAAEIIARQSEHCLIVTRDEMVVGIVTASDIIEKVVAVGARIPRRSTSGTSCPLPSSRSALRRRQNRPRSS